MALQTRNSALAVLKEVTEGVPVAPSAGSDYLALQDDFTMSPSFNTLTNAEARASIGLAKPILGAENPTASMSHYLRSSGVEGQAPNFGEFLEAAYGAVKSTAARVTVDSSTTTVTTLTAGQVTTQGIARGDAFIILDPANGYSIRNVASVSGDALTWDFALEAAPANGVELSRCVTYYPTQTGQPTLTLWHYVANDGAVQMMAGARPTSVAISIDAGELINASYSFEGLSYYFNPIEITASTKDLDFTDDDGTFVASVAVGYYKDPNDLAEALQAAMNATASTQTYSVVYENNPEDPNIAKFTIENTTGALLSLLWNTGANTATTIGTKLGFLVAADDTGSLSYTGDNVLDFSSPQNPSFDSADALAAKSNEFLIGDASDNVCVDASSVTWNVDLTKVNIESICAESGISESVYNERSVPVTATILLKKGEAKRFHKFHKNDSVAIAYHFGDKAGGNWVIGKSGSLYVPEATITSFEIGDEDGYAVLNLEFQAYVNQDGEGEVYQNFL